MTAYPYTIATGRLKEFLLKLKDIGVPPNIKQRWLESLGYKSKNDRPFLSILAFIGFVDSSSVPTNRWIRYRGAESKVALAEGIKLGYKELFEMYPDAEKRSGADLEHFFNTASPTTGSKATSSMISTFKVLCELADLTQIKTEKSQKDRDAPETGPLKLHNGGPEDKQIDKGVVININIQLTIPETSDSTVYDNFFAAMKKHLFKE
jgi:hypothetical protein